MSFYPIQTSFMAGEISPRLYGRMDLPWYKHGVEYSENFLHLPQGPARYRIGTEYLFNAYQNGGIRLIPFNVLNGPDIILELGPGSARLVNDKGVIDLTTIGQLILNNDFTSGSSNWSTRSGYVDYEFRGDQSCVDMLIPEWDPTIVDPGPIPKPPHPPTIVAPWVQQALIGVVSGNYRFQVTFPTLDATDAGYTAKTIRVDIGTTAGGSEIYTSSGHYNDSIDTTVTVSGGPVTVYIRFTMTGTLAFHSEVRVQYPRFTGASIGPGIHTGMPWTEAMLPGIQYAQDIFYGMVLVHPLMAPQKVTYDGALFTIAPISFTDPPSVWGTNNYPSVVDIWQARLWFANTPQQPTTLWASKVNDYVIFTIPGTPNAQSPLFLTLGTKGSIKWIRGKQAMLVGTDLHEDVIVSATQVVSSLDAQLIRQSGYGSAPIQAQEIGDQVLFVSREQFKLRSLNFNFDTQAWLAHDISYYAQGITLPGITDVAYARDPDNTIYVLTTDQSMRMCTYDRLSEVIAWSRWTTQGSVKAICATIDPTGTTLWMAVNRGGTTSIEAIPPFTVQTPVFLDSYVQVVPTVYTPIGETTNRISIACGHHLDGFMVGVVVDSNYLGQAEVVAGVVDLPFAGDTATTASVGLTYTGTLRTLPLDGGVMYGTSAGLKKSRNKIFVRLLPGSNVPLVNGQRPASRYPVTPMNTNSPIPIGEWDWWIINPGFDRYARVEITHNVPFQCDVAAIFGRAEVTQD